MIDTSTIQAILRSVGIAISDEEAKRLGPLLAGILADLRKLDELEREGVDPTPRFTVEEIK